MAAKILFYFIVLLTGCGSKVLPRLFLMLKSNHSKMLHRLRDGVFFSDKNGKRHPQTFTDCIFPWDYGNENRRPWLSRHHPACPGQSQRLYRFGTGLGQQNHALTMLCACKHIHGLHFLGGVAMVDQIAHIARGGGGVTAYHHQSRRGHF